MSILDLLDDQRMFNRQLWDGAGRSEAERNERFRILALGMMEETMEFLRTFEYKTHRRKRGALPNIAHSHEELIDMFKFWLSLADVADFPMDQLESLYYAKSRVVQYRYQDEWLKEINRPCVVVDIDEVLAEYIHGICTWAVTHGPTLWERTGRTDQSMLMQRAAYVASQRISPTAESMGVTFDEWQALKHHFRTNGGKRMLVPCPDAHEFLEWCRSRGWIIILVTSRPMDRYPNLFTDTLTWLTEHDLPFDHLWWADDKARSLQETYGVMKEHIVFAVDDYWKFVEQFRSRGILTFHLDRAGAVDKPWNREHITQLSDIRVYLETLEAETVIR